MNNSMINPSVVDLLEKVNDRYSLVILTSKRARQIIGGSKPKIDIDTNKAFPDTGCEFFSADYSQIELRIMAHLSDCLLYTSCANLCNLW